MRRIEYEDDSNIWPTAESPSMVRYAAQHYADLLRGANHSVDVFSGEAHVALYSDPDLMQAFRDARRKGVRIRIVVGPVLSIYRKPDGSVYSGLIELMQDGTVEVLQRPTRETGEHYKIIDATEAELEHAHSPLTPMSQREIVSRPAGSLHESFLSYLAEGRTKPVKGAQDFLLLTEEEILDVARSAGSDYDAMTKEAISDRHAQLAAQRKQAQDGFDARFRAAMRRRRAG